MEKNNNFDHLNEPNLDDILASLKSVVSSSDNSRIQGSPLLLSSNINDHGSKNRLITFKNTSNVSNSMSSQHLAPNNFNINNNSNSIIKTNSSNYIMNNDRSAIYPINNTGQPSNFRCVNGNNISGLSLSIQVNNSHSQTTNNQVQFKNIIPNPVRNHMPLKNTPARDQSLSHNFFQNKAATNISDLSKIQTNCVSNNNIPYIVNNLVINNPNSNHVLNRTALMTSSSTVQSRFVYTQKNDIISKNTNQIRPFNSTNINSNVPLENSMANSNIPPSSQPIHQRFNVTHGNATINQSISLNKSLNELDPTVSRVFMAINSDNKHISRGDNVTNCKDQTNIATSSESLLNKTGKRQLNPSETMARLIPYHVANDDFNASSRKKLLHRRSLDIKLQQIYVRREKVIHRLSQCSLKVNNIDGNNLRLWKYWLANEKCQLDHDKKLLENGSYACYCRKKNNDVVGKKHIQNVNTISYASDYTLEKNHSNKIYHK